MRLTAFWCAFAALFVFAVPGNAQVAPRLPYEGATPDPSGTSCPGEATPAVPQLSPAARVKISAASEANFRARNNNGARGVFIVILRQDGQRAALIPPTADIDPELHAVLSELAQRVTTKNPIPNCAHVGVTVVVGFEIIDGTVGLDRTTTLAPPNAEPTGAAPFIGPTPDAAGTPCPGERDPGRGLRYPQKIGIAPESVTYFRAHNAVSEGVFIVEVRLDGQAAINIPERLNIDQPLREVLIAFTQKIGLRPPIAGCARPAVLLIGRFSLADGTVVLAPPPPPKAP